MSTLKPMYKGQANSPFTTTLGELSASATSVTVQDASVLPSTVPFLLTLGYDKSVSETVLVTAVNGNVLTIIRGVDGSALLWIAGTKCARVFTAKDLNDLQDNVTQLNTDKAEPGDIPSAYTSTPAMDGTGSAGSGTAYARGDHVHPTDTSRQAKITASGLLKGDGSGGVSAAAAGTDYQAPLTAGTDYATPGSIPAASSSTPLMDGTGSSGSETAYARGNHRHPTDTTRQAKITASGLLKGDGDGGVSAATAGTDYQAPPATATALPTSGTVLNADTEYRPANTVGTYQFNFPTSGDVYVRFTTGSTFTITFASGTEFMGSMPVFEASTTYELLARDKIVAVGKVISS